jgi:hypothetical protein
MLQSAFNNANQALPVSLNKPAKGSEVFQMWPKCRRVTTYIDQEKCFFADFMYKSVSRLAAIMVCYFKNWSIAKYIGF